MADTTKPGDQAVARSLGVRIHCPVVVRLSSAYRTLQDLAGQTLACPTPAGFAASLLVQAELRRQGVVFTPRIVKSHNSVYRVVALGLYPGGGGMPRPLELIDEDALPARIQRRPAAQARPGHRQHLCRDDPRCGRQHRSGEPAVICPPAGRQPDISFARVLDASGRVLAQDGSAEALRRANALVGQPLDSAADLYAVAAPVAAGNTTYGSVQLGFDIRALDARQQRLLTSADVSARAPLSVLGDESRLRQVLINLGGNAVKFTAQGEIALRVAFSALPGLAGQPRLRFEVSDTGIGIEASQQARIFESFVQADAGMARQYGGTSLGLSISAAIVQHMGGHIAVRSAPGEGSCFNFELDLELPAAAPTGALTAPSPPIQQSLATSTTSTNATTTTTTPPAADPPLRGLHLLVAEDNLINQLVAEELIAAAGATVDLVDDGLQAVQRVQAHPQGYYHLVLMDMQMPRMDGLEATRAIRTAGHIQLPIVAVTANVAAADREICLAAGMNDLLGKPYMPERLIEMVLRHTTGAAKSAQAEAGPTNGLTD
ncbi:MAG: hypothetical protein RIQ60_1952 [Pseudomonadota bacterium]